MLRSEHEANPGMHCEPFLGVLSCSRADVVGDDDEWSPPDPSDKLIEEREYPGNRPIWSAPKENLSVLDVERREQIPGALALVLELDSRGFAGTERSRRVDAPQGLNARFLVIKREW